MLGDHDSSRFEVIMSIISLLFSSSDLAFGLVTIIPTFLTFYVSLIGCHVFVTRQYIRTESSVLK